jgi:hypothetical protein
MAAATGMLRWLTLVKMRMNLKTQTSGKMSLKTRVKMRMKMLK